MTKTAEWNEIINLWRGLKLAVHTDIATGNTNMVNLDDLKTQEALGWLVYHRLVWHDGHAYVARTPLEARKLWEAEGPAKLDAANVARSLPMPTPAPEAPPPAPAVVVPMPDQSGEPAAHAVHPMRPHQATLFS